MRSILCAILLIGAALFPPAGLPDQQAPKWDVLGNAPGAAALKGYVIHQKPFLPIKKFASEAGYKTSVSPSGRNIAILVGSKSAMIINADRVLLDGKELALSQPPVERENDVFLPIDFFEKLFPAHFEYMAEKKRVTARLPGKNLTVPLEKLPDSPPKP